MIAGPVVPVTPTTQSYRRRRVNRETNIPDEAGASARKRRDHIRPHSSDTDTVSVPVVPVTRGRLGRRSRKLRSSRVVISDSESDQSADGSTSPGEALPRRRLRASTLKRTSSVRIDETDGSIYSEDSVGASSSGELEVSGAKKDYLDKGLYSSPSGKKGGSLLPLPQGAALKQMNAVSDFKLPFNIYCPQHSLRRVINWKGLKKNIWLDNSQEIFERLGEVVPYCNCEAGNCGEECLNRLSQIECDPSCCSSGKQDCGNRALQMLAGIPSLFGSGTSTTSGGGRRYARGYEIFRTGAKGYGLRATREYAPHELVVEYTGEIINVKEMEHRLACEYRGLKNYYCLSLGSGLVIDGGMKGSEARFVNHSCQPNCEMEKWHVKGLPRVGLFVGDEPIPAGTEFTYDYNFDIFGGAVAQICHCGTEKCRGVIGKRSDSGSSSSSKSPDPIEQPTTPRTSLRKTRRKRKTPSKYADEVLQAAVHERTKRRRMSSAASNRASHNRLNISALEESVLLSPRGIPQIPSSVPSERRYTRSLGPSPKMDFDKLDILHKRKRRAQGQEALFKNITSASSSIAESISGTKELSTLGGSERSAKSDSHEAEPEKSSKKRRKKRASIKGSYYYEPIAENDDPHVAWLKEVTAAAKQDLDKPTHQARRLRGSTTNASNQGVTEPVLRRRRVRARHATLESNRTETREDPRSRTNSTGSHQTLPDKSSEQNARSQSTSGDDIPFQPPPESVPVADHLPQPVQDSSASPGNYPSKNPEQCTSLSSRYQSRENASAASGEREAGKGGITLPSLAQGAAMSTSTPFSEAPGQIQRNRLPPISPRIRENGIPRMAQISVPPHDARNPMTILMRELQGELHRPLRDAEPSPKDSVDGAGSEKPGKSVKSEPQDGLTPHHSPDKLPVLSSLGLQAPQNSSSMGIPRVVEGAGFTMQPNIVLENAQNNATRAQNLAYRLLPHTPDATPELGPSHLGVVPASMLGKGPFGGVAYGSGQYPGIAVLGAPRNQAVGSYSGSAMFREQGFLPAIGRGAAPGQQYGANPVLYPQPLIPPAQPLGGMGYVPMVSYVVMAPRLAQGGGASMDPSSMDQDARARGTSATLANAQLSTTQTHTLHRNPH